MTVPSVLIPRLLNAIPCCSPAANPNCAGVRECTAPATAETARATTYSQYSGEDPRRYTSCGFGSRGKSGSSMKPPTDGAEWLCVACTITDRGSSPKRAAVTLRILCVYSSVIASTSKDKKQIRLRRFSMTRAFANNGSITCREALSTPRTLPPRCVPGCGEISTAQAPACSNELSFL